MFQLCEAAPGRSSGSGLVDILRAGRIVEPGSCMVYLIAESTNCVQGVPVVVCFETPDGPLCYLRLFRKCILSSNRRSLGMLANLVATSRALDFKEVYSSCGSERGETY